MLGAGFWTYEPLNFQLSALMAFHATSPYPARLIDLKNEKSAPLPSSQQ